MTFTNNYVANPSFQGGLTGYSVILDSSSNPTAKMYLDNANILYGTQSLLVITNGTEAGEGVNLYEITASDTATFSASCYITGSGNVTVVALVNGVEVASAP